MRLNTSIESWAARFFFALAITPLAACGVSSGSSGSAGNPGTPVTCDDPQPYLTATDSGYERCSNGVVHRREALSCPAPTATACMNSADAGGTGGGTAGGCTTNADCTAFPGGYCEASSPGCACIYSCQTDADCGAGNSCECGPYQGQCVTSTCKTDADCGGFLCALEPLTDANGCVTGEQLACMTAADTCNTDADCQAGVTCARINGHLACSDFAPSPATCCANPLPVGGCGRPFLIGNTARQAEAAPRSDWTAAGQEVRLDGIDARERAALAAHWTRIGLMEHASIAAFARFSLQLLAVGAPPELVRDAQAAMTDETDHTLLSFALASAYAGRSIGPGRLALAGALDAQDDRAILITTIREGCIGETLAAIEAAEASAHAEDPAVRAVLAKIAVDEERHALLAWRYVAWAIAGNAELAAVARAELDAALSEPIVVASRGEDAMLAHGVTGEARGAEIRRQAMATVIRPAARGVLAS
jgi:hypothetical protein